MQTDDQTLRTYTDVVTDYRQRYAAAHRAEMNLFGNPRQTLPEAIHRACRSQVPKKHGRGLKRHSHQPLRSVPDDALLEAASRLERRAADIGAATDFSGLHALVDAGIRPISGIGELAVYDIALRIGAYRGLRPSEIYLHAGTREGVAAIGLDAARKSIPMTSLPVEIQSLGADEAEDVLCIYRHSIARIRQGDGAPSPASACRFPDKPNARRTRASRCY
jgi:hypothetical protein